MTKISAFVAASAVSLLVASPALAGWDRARVWDPAFDRSIDRQIELNAGNGAAASGTAVATNDAAPAPLAAKHYFGAGVDRFVDSVDSPYDN